MLPHPPALQSPAPVQPPGPLALARAEDLVLAAWDDGLPLPEPKVAPSDRPALAWLRAAAGTATPTNPFKPGTPAHAEAKAWLAFLKAPEATRPARLAGLPLALTGTQLALWRWGQAASFTGTLAPAERRIFEDRLAASAVAGLRHLGLRHALCHAVAGRDEGRFAQLRERYGFLEEDLFLTYQRLFSLLGGPAPDFRLYTLPGLAYEDLPLARLGSRRIWMSPAGSGTLDTLAADVAWIVPSALGAQDPVEARLEGSAAEEAAGLARRFTAAGRKAWFAASRKPFEDYGLMHFPILIELDGEGRIQGIRMGDAAPARP